MTQPVFKVFTDAMIPYTKSVDGVERKFIKTTASSTVTDRKGHEFDVTALQKMGVAAKGMTIFLNHSYEVPEDLFGTVVEAEAKPNGFDSNNDAIWDLGFEVMLNEANPRAVQAWEAYGQGVRMGVSVGVLVNQWEKSKKNPDVKRITDVEFLEASIVGIPANPRTWVHNAFASIDKVEAANEDGTIETLALIDETKGLAEDIANAEVVDETDTDDDGNPLDPTNDDSLADQEEAKSLTDEANTEAAEELKSDPEATEGATQDASDVEAAAAPEVSVASGVDLLVNAYKTEIQELRAQLADSNKERDEAREQARLAMEIVGQISSMPLGRKATFQQSINAFRRDLSGVYDADFLAFLDERKQ